MAGPVVTRVHSRRPTWETLGRKQPPPRIVCTSAQDLAEHEATLRSTLAAIREVTRSRERRRDGDVSESSRRITSNGKSTRGAGDTKTSPAIVGFGCDKEEVEVKGKKPAGGTKTSPAIVGFGTDKEEVEVKGKKPAG